LFSLKKRTIIVFETHEQKLKEGSNNGGDD